MTNAEKKRILRDYKRIDIQIRALYAELDNVITLIQSPNLDGLPTSANSERDLADLLIKKDELLAKILDDISRKEKAKRRIDDALDAMRSETERTLLILRYKRGMTFEQIAEALEYSWRHTVRLHGSALAHFMEDR
jgi:DNA-directed RNA polymerase specialized sigma subunit